MSTIEDKAAIRLGRAVKARREELGFTLRGLAAMSRISPSMISDIERGTKSPTIATLSLLARALSVPIAALVDTDLGSERIRVVRGSERQARMDAVSGAKRENFGPAPATSTVEFLRYTVPPRTLAGPFAAHASGTIEHIVVASGAIRIVCGNDAATLEAGDSCTCFADAPHAFDNTDGDIEALIYLVIEGGSRTRRGAARSAPKTRRRAPRRVAG